MANYQTAILSYLDVLGFRDLVEQSKEAAGHVDTILQILRTMQTQFSSGGRVEVDTENKPQSVFRFLNFSDLMIRATFVSQNINVVDYLTGNC